MPLAIPRSLVEYILLGPVGDRRQLQDSPVLGDVWIAYATEPEKPQELLITPDREQPAGHAARRIHDFIAKRRTSELPIGVAGPQRVPTEIAYLQGTIAAQLYFDELLLLVPMTDWWSRDYNQQSLKEYKDDTRGSRRLDESFRIIKQMLIHWSNPKNSKKAYDRFGALDRYAALAGIILWAVDRPAITSDWPQYDLDVAGAIEGGIESIKSKLQGLFEEVLAAENAKRGRRSADAKRRERDVPLLYEFSLNRPVSIALTRSVPAVKADAARALFNVDCSTIGWAIIDTGIHADHPSFEDEKGDCRVLGSYDFSNFREIVSLDNIELFSSNQPSAEARRRLGKLCCSSLYDKMSERAAIRSLKKLGSDLSLERPVQWELVEPFVRIKKDVEIGISDHGTHVAGILGARRAGKPAGAGPRDQSDADGMCPDIKLYDFRVVSDDPSDTEFAVIAALQFIRYLNERHEFMTIHGANLSLSIPHDVRNYACGRTPICDECERLVNSGVVVVAAAGNRGYQSFTTKEGSYEGYAAFSITDPGNADGVITVGSTHRYSPHTYGVSFFSSRGPTGDGRMKPDLVAPGERIRAPYRADSYRDLDGTSMAAPHVSGAAAMLMARYSELIAQPRRIKEILCKSATDLGRERSFQGHGMLDVLRAFQSI